MEEDLVKRYIIKVKFTMDNSPETTVIKNTDVCDTFEESFVQAIKIKKYFDGLTDVKLYWSQFPRKDTAFYKDSKEVINGRLVKVRQYDDLLYGCPLSLHEEMERKLKSDESYDSFISRTVGQRCRNSDDMNEYYACRVYMGR